MIDPDKIYVLEWSRSQECFHIHTLKDCLTKNLESIIEAHRTDFLPDYLPIAFNETGKFFSSDEAEDVMRRKLMGLPPEPPCQHES